MKWFTRSWARADSRWPDPVIVSYEQHARDLAERAPRVLSDMIRQSDSRLQLDDALVRDVSENRREHVVALDLVQGALSPGYGHLSIVFTDAQLSGSWRSAFATARIPEVWYFEFDRAEDDATIFELRLLLLPRGEMRITFRDVAWRWSPRRSRRICRRQAPC
jgi:hypothetical protein